MLLVFDLINNWGKKLMKVRSWMFFIFLILFFIASGYIIYYVEPETFGSPFNGLWWVFVFFHRIRKKN